MAPKPSQRSGADPDLDPVGSNCVFFKYQFGSKFYKDSYADPGKKGLVFENTK